MQVAQTKVLHHLQVISQSGGAVSLANSGVSANSYGSATNYLL